MFLGVQLTMLNYCMWTLVYKTQGQKTEFSGRHIFEKLLGKKQAELIGLLYVMKSYDIKNAPINVTTIKIAELKNADSPISVFNLHC